MDMVLGSSDGKGYPIVSCDEAIGRLARLLGHVKLVPLRAAPEWMENQISTWFSHLALFSVKWR